MERVEGLSGAIITTIYRNPLTSFPFDRFTLGEACPCQAFPFVLFYVLVVEGANERFTDALYAFSRRNPGHGDSLAEL